MPHERDGTSLNGRVTPLMFSSTDNPFAFRFALVWKGATRPPSSTFVISQNQTRALASSANPSLPNPSRFWSQLWKTTTEAAKEAAKPAPKPSARPGKPVLSPALPQLAPLRPEPARQAPALGIDTSPFHGTAVFSTSHTLSVCVSLCSLSDVSPFPC